MDNDCLDTLIKYILEPPTEQRFGKNHHKHYSLLFVINCMSDHYMRWVLNVKTAVKVYGK